MVCLRTPPVIVVLNFMPPVPTMVAANAWVVVLAVVLAVVATIVVRAVVALPTLMEMVGAVVALIIEPVGIMVLVAVAIISELECIISSI